MNLRIATGIVLLAANACLADDALRVPATEPAQAESTIQTLDGFRMKLIAAEPLLTDPVAMTYDENGVAYVAEMNDYPYTDKKNDIAWKDNTVDPPIGKIRMLVDTDGNGTFDKSYIFADELSWPTGVAPWKGGIFVAATPDIWYFKDTDGDHKADVKIKVFTGFRKYNVQAVMNNLIWGLDHQIYGSGSGNGGSITSPERPGEKPVAMTRHDFKFDPNTKEFEALPGGGRFGNTFDDWGNRFICNIRNPAIHAVLPSKYLARNPYLTVRSAVHDAAKAGDTLPVYRLSPSEPWRVVRAQRWAGETNSKYPRSETIPDGYFTSASGITIYRGSAYPTQYYGNVFLGEVAGNLIHRELLKPDGVTFSAERAEQKTEFARSKDIWFRPVNFVNAPDGTLHVLDMYRETIEHPWSIPDDIKAQLDLVNGRDRGRIYRLEPPEFKVPKPPRLGKATTEELVTTLENLNSWWRETAHRLIFERQDQAAVKPLRKLLRSSKSPVARLHALFSLDGLGALTDDDILTGLDDSSGGVREHAVRFAESRLNKSPKLLSKVLKATEDPEIRVRFQTAFSLGEATSAAAATGLFKIAKRDAADEWVQAAVLSSSAAHGRDLIKQSLENPAFAVSEPGRGFIRQLSFMVGVKNNSNEVRAVLAAMTSEKVDAKVQQTIVLGLGDGLKRAGKSLRVVAGDSIAAGQVIQNLLQQSQKLALDVKTPLSERKEAIQFLAQDGFENVENALVELIKPSQPKDVQIAAIGTLKTFTNKKVGEVLLRGWASYTPFIRNEVVEAMLARAERLPLLLDAVEKGTVAVGFIPQARKTMLMNHANPKIKSRATELFGRTSESSRAEVVKRYQNALALKGDSGRGHQIYTANCASCHRNGREGAEVGPNLATIHAWTPDQVLLNVLDPNKEISPNYVNYTVMLKNGETASGLIAEETPTSISLKRANNVQETILRQNIESIASSGISLMPEGMENAISEQQMADLIAFLLGAE